MNRDDGALGSWGKGSADFSPSDSDGNPTTHHPNARHEPSTCLTIHTPGTCRGKRNCADHGVSSVVARASRPNHFLGFGKKWRK
jgi:hypothetical protein